MHTKTQLVELLRVHGLRLRKRLGQNYLVDQAMAKRLVAGCDLDAADTVVEIGAGLGALTDLIAARVTRVYAVDVDDGICRILRARLASLPNVEVQCQDILAFPWADHPGVKVIGAIPYQITSPILVSLAEHARHIRAAWLAVQREVAQRLRASPGTKAYGRLSVLAQYRFDVALVWRIPRTAFFPEPAVDSSWVALTPRTHPAAHVADEALFFGVVRAAFAQRRKMLSNCLELVAERAVAAPVAHEAIRQAGLPARVRGEDLSLEAFARLTETLDALVSSEGQTRA